MATERTATDENGSGDDRIEGLDRHVTLADGDREPVPVEAPFSGDRIGSVPQCVRTDVELAVDRAREAQTEWGATSADERATVILRLHDLVLDRQDELLDVMQLEAGKARRDAHEEILDLAQVTRHYAHRVDSYLQTDRRKGAFPIVTRAEVHHRPVGVVGMISPWNYPLVLTLSEAVPALLAGNAVVVKPAEQTPYTALLAKELLAEAGLPPGCLQVVTGDGEPIGEPLLDGVQYIAFTGSTEVGRIVASQAGERLVDVSLELGGKNAAIVREDADLDRAVRGLLQGCFSSAGQLCISFERIYVHEAIHDEFRRRFVDATADLTLGTSFDYHADVGSLISQQQLETVRSHVEGAKSKGATVETGGVHRPDVGPYFYEPTVLTDVTDDMRARDVETFGPVTRIEPYSDVDEAVRRTNDTDYGLNASVWTGDASRGREIATRIDAGTVNVNDSYVAAWGSTAAPMGGMKNSGIGRRHGTEGFFKYTEPQTIATQRFVPTGPPDGREYETYARNLSRILRFVKNIPGLR